MPEGQRRQSLLRGNGLEGKTGLYIVRNKKRLHENGRRMGGTDGKRTGEDAGARRDRQGAEWTDLRLTVEQGLVLAGKSVEWLGKLGWYWGSGKDKRHTDGQF